MHGGLVEKGLHAIEIEYWFEQDSGNRRETDFAQHDVPAIKAAVHCRVHKERYACVLKIKTSDVVLQQGQALLTQGASRITY